MTFSLFPTYRLRFWQRQYLMSGLYYIILYIYIYIYRKKERKKERKPLIIYINFKNPFDSLAKDKLYVQLYIYGKK